MAHRGKRSPANWRYRVIKGYKQRAFRFYQNSKTEEEAKAWVEVMRWFNSILKESRCITPNGAIGLTDDFPVEVLVK